MKLKDYYWLNMPFAKEQILFDSTHLQQVSGPFRDKKSKDRTLLGVGQEGVGE